MGSKLFSPVFLFGAPHHQSFYVLTVQWKYFSPLFSKVATKFLCAVWHRDCSLECFGQQIEISAAHTPLGGPIILHLGGASANSWATMKSGVGAAASNRYRRPTCVPSDIPPPDNHYIWVCRHSVCQRKHTRGRWRRRRCEGVVGRCWGYISVDKGGRCRVNAVGQPCNWTHRGGWRCPQPRGIFLWPMTALARKNPPSLFSP